MTTEPRTTSQAARRADNVDVAALHQFEQAASRWWDAGGEFKELHKLNPLRLAYIESRFPLPQRRVLDVGCGGGLLSEAMARKGALVTGIDVGSRAVEVARLHLEESDLQVDYRHIDAEMLARQEPGRYDAVTCLEILEHVPDPARLVSACAALAAPGGHVFFSTINRNLKSFLAAIVAAEYILKLLPAATHEYAKFIRPSELTGAAYRAGLEPSDIIGIAYNPLTKQYHTSPSPNVNYVMHFVKPAHE